MIALPARLPHWAILLCAAAAMAVLPAPALGTQLALALPAVIGFGLPHGAADWWLAARMLPQRLPNPKLWPLAFGVFYLVASVLTAACIAATPLCMLALFIGLSAWHFGETDARAHGIETPIAALPAGVLPIAAPMALQPAQTEDVLQRLGVSADPATLHAACMAILLIALAGSLAFALARPDRPRLHLLREQAAVLLLALAAPPIVFFAVYFCVLHAPRQAASLSVRGPAAVAWIAAAAASVLIGAGLLLLPSGALPLALPVRGLFWGLAVLTVPHVIANVFFHPASSFEEEAPAS